MTLPGGTDGFARARLARGHRDRRNCELEGRAAPIAGGHPDPTAEAALDHEAAQIQAESDTTLRPVPSRRAGFLEQPFEATRGEALTMVGNRHLEPAPRGRARLHRHGSLRVFQRVADEVRQHLTPV